MLCSQLPTAADRDAYEQVKNSPPSAETHPNLFAWFYLVAKFRDNVRDTWAAAGAPAKAAEKKPVAAPKKEEPKKEEAPKEEGDDMDLFGEETEEDAVSPYLIVNQYLNIIQEAKAKLEEAKKKAQEKKKAGPIAKSLIIWEVKPYEAETDLDALAKEILKIEMDGLVWKTEYKKEPIAYGVYKILIGCVIEDEKVSTDDLQEKIEAFEDLVQSVDIAAFNKI